MLSVVPLATLISLGPHGHQAIGTADQALEQVLPLWVRGQGSRATAVLPQVCLYQVEDLLADEGLVNTLVQLISMLDQPSVEGTMQNAPERGGGEQPGA